MSRALAVLLLAASFATAQDARQIMQEAQRRQQSQSQHYEGTLEVIGSGSRIATKRWVFDRLGVFGNSKAMLRFTAPAHEALAPHQLALRSATAKSLPTSVSCP
jgi:hypothetical protein